ncbi:tRNA adenosine(34) deaminase TadA [Oceanicoccus sagamiensis]|uniref:tRNA-specific adenosine deaminase n=1 Tax=Oceanicoccus sagamiensis TaxID=716816 RepID=A0A1X9NHL5_9GAMM|nr:tRNA adenosine(34) deaminase TadA [Oceanicoccus sagamiensis]ARN75335.1 tRNA adenosine(34) deaminase TadA [Oceanicoccus sagamiensis]
MPTDQDYMQRALELAGVAAQHGEVPVGAVVVLNERIVGEGWNQPILSNDPTAHAEVVALRNAAIALANYRLNEAILYVTIEPCTMCAGALIHSRIAKVVYGATEPKSGVAQSNGCLFDEGHFNHRVAVQGGVMAEQCAGIMSDFFASRRLQKKAQKADQSGL